VDLYHRYDCTSHYLACSNPRCESKGKHIDVPQAPWWSRKCADTSAYETL